MRKSSSACCQRESLDFGDLNEVVAHARSLSESDYQTLGNWSLGQVCNHLAATMDCSIDGFPTALPAPVAAVMRWSFFSLPFMPRLISRFRAPTIPALAQKDPVADAEGLRRLVDAVVRVSAPDVVFQPNPIMGQFTPEQWHRFHLWHAQHHLSFLKSLTPDQVTAASGSDESVPDAPALSP